LKDLLNALRHTIGPTSNLAVVSTVILPKLPEIGRPFTPNWIGFALPWKYSLMTNTVFPQDLTPEPKAHKLTT